MLSIAKNSWSLNCDPLFTVATLKNEHPKYRRGDEPESTSESYFLKQAKPPYSEKVHWYYIKPLDKQVRAAFCIFSCFSFLFSAKAHRKAGIAG